MKKLIIILIIFALFVDVKSQIDVINTYYVATDGNDDTGDGSISTPWATWQKGLENLQKGDTLYLRGGTYLNDLPINIDPTDDTPVGYTGTRDSVITVMSYPGEWAVLDCRLHCDNIPDSPFGSTYNSAMNFGYVEFWHLKNFEVKSVYQCDSVLNASLNAVTCRYFTFEHIILHDIGQRGLWYESGAWIDYYNGGYIETAPYWDTNDDTTRFINVDIYDAFDTLSTHPGNGADGFFCAGFSGNVYIWEGCRVWYHSDDGWNSDAGGGLKKIINNCWAMASNKYAELVGYGISYAEKNGYKCGGPYDFPMPDYNTLISMNNLAVFNNYGFNENTVNRGGYYNNTSIYNNVGFYSGTVAFFDAYPDTAEYIRPLMKFRNNIAWGSNNSDFSGGFQEAYIPGGWFPESHNTFDYTEGQSYHVLTDSVTVTIDDFYYDITDSLLIDSLFTAPRNADGSLPDNPFRLAESSDLINAGTEIPLSDAVLDDINGANLVYPSIAFSGSSRDIGAFEYTSNAGIPTVKKIGRSNGAIGFYKGKIMQKR